MKTRNLILTGALLFLCAAGCKVDPLYDLSNLVTEITVLKGATFPVPSPRPISLADILNLDGFPYIVVDGNGDYLISFSLDPVDMSVMIPPEVSGGQIPSGYEPETYSFGGVPDFLSSDGQHVEPDLSEMELRLSIDSGIPAVFTVSSRLETFRNGSLQRSYLVENLQVPFGKSDYLLTEHPDGGMGAVWVPELGKLLSPVPDEFKISALDVFATDEQLALVTPGQVYDLTCQASVRAPISFSENTHFKVSAPLEAELNLEQIGLKKAALHLDVQNSIPLDFTVDLYALDGDGKRIDSIQFFDSGSVSVPGSSTIPLCLNLTTSGDLRFASLVLTLSASSKPELAGVHFNRSQVIRFSNLYLELPDGIQVKLDESEK
jgi:hypothetical protein